MTMPKMTGDELSRKIKHIRPDIPVILCTGNKIAEESAGRLDVEAIMMKPVSLKEMAEIVRKELDRKQGS